MYCKILGEYIEKFTLHSEIAFRYEPKHLEFVICKMGPNETCLRACLCEVGHLARQGKIDFYMRSYVFKPALS